MRGQLLDALGPGGPVTPIDAGCGNGGTAGVSGPLALGNVDFAFTLSGADPAATLAVFVLNAPVAPLPCGACSLTPPLVSAGLPLAGGATLLPTPIPCNMALIGGALQFQWWVAPTAVSPCALLPGASFSGRGTGR